MTRRSPSPIINPHHGRRLCTAARLVDVEMAIHPVHSKPARRSSTLSLGGIKGIRPPAPNDQARACVVQNVLVQPLQPPKGRKGSRTHRSRSRSPYASAHSPQTHHARLHSQVVTAPEPIATRSADDTRSSKPEIPTRVPPSCYFTQRVRRLGPAAPLSGLPSVCQACHCTSLRLRSRGSHEDTESTAPSRVYTRED